MIIFQKGGRLLKSSLVISFAVMAGILMANIFFLLHDWQFPHLISAYTFNNELFTSVHKKPSNLGRCDFEKPLSADGKNDTEGKANETETGFIPLAPSLLGKPDCCWSRHERGRFRPPAHFDPSQALVAAIRRYEVLHRNCTVKVVNWSAAFEGTETHTTGEDGAGGPCRYIVWSVNTALVSSGFGNRILSLVCAFLYALLTDRVLFVDTIYGDQFPGLLCDPFPDSSWWTPLSKDQHDLLYTKPRVDDYVQGVANNTGFDKRYAVFDWSNFRFFCEDAQRALGNATWLHYTTFLYQTAPMFAVKSFRPRLQELFPDNEVLVHLARYLIHPSNNMWSRISVAAEARLRTADTRIGVQIRDFQGYDEQISARVRMCIESFCLVRSRPSEESWAETLQKPDEVERRDTPRVTSMLVTALQEKFYLDMKEEYETRTGRDEEVVSVYSESHENFEHRGMDQSERALVEIWLLSFSDHLMISFMSTFGYLAAALSARLPIYLNIVNRPDLNKHWTNNGAPACERALTLEGCMHVDPQQHCPGDGYYVGHKGGQSLGRYNDTQPCRDYHGGVVLLHKPLPPWVEAVQEDGTRFNLTLVFD